jgi:hypothetical protein
MPLDLSNFSAIQDIIDQYNETRNARIRTYWDYYLGNHLLYFEKWEDETEKHFNDRAKYVIPICMKVVNIGARWLYGKHQPKRRCSDKALDEILQDILRKNTVHRISRNWATMGGVTGNAFVTLGWRQGRVQWGLEDTENVYWIPDPKRPSSPLAVVIRKNESTSSAGEESGCLPCGLNHRQAFNETADMFLQASGVSEGEPVAVRTEVITPPTLNDDGTIAIPGIWHVYMNEYRVPEEEFEGGINPYPFLPVVNFINIEVPNTADGLSDLHCIVDLNIEEYFFHILSRRGCYTPFHQK